MNLKTLFTDLDGVIRSWAAQDGDIESRFGLPPGAIRSTIFAEHYLNDAITGVVSDAQWRQDAIERLQAAWPGADAAKAMTAWSAYPGSVQEDVMRLIREARQRLRVVLITNATDRLDADLLVLDLHREFDHVVNSSTVGIAKPDSGIFMHALEVCGISADEAAFVDDQAKNVEAARSLGIVSHRFEDTDALRRFLRGHGIISRNAGTSAEAH